MPTPAVKTATFTHLVVHRPLANQVEINAACPFPSPSSAADVMTYRAAAQSISARLFASLRQDAGLTYGFSSDVVIAPRSATLLLSGLVDAARFADALALVRDQLTTPRRPALDAAALSQTRWALAKSVAMGYQTTQEIAHKVFSSLVMGFGNQGVQLEAQLAVNVSGESVGQALAACLPRIVYAFVGDEKRINASLATGLN